MTAYFTARVLGLAALLVAHAACAQSYPARPITLVVPFAAGASADGIARVLAKDMSASLGQPVVVENKPGGGGAVGLIVVSHAKPDGYTLGLGATGAIAVNPHLPGASPLKPDQDLAAVAKLANVPLVMVAGKATGYASLKALFEKAGSKPGEALIYGTPGQYTAQHLAGELIGEMAGMKMSAVPYRGSGPAVTDVLGGQIGLAVVDLTSAYPHVKSGALIALGVTSAQRTKVAPDLPTIAEGGLAGYDAPAWMGLFGPAGLPPAVANKVADAVREALGKPAVQQQVIGLAAEPDYADAEHFAAFTRAESQRWGQLLQSISVSRQ
ncbi:tripartite tricarboxylate transporter substrate binding protein [Bordetella sp. BOR01]|uniref:Bug family tripartite tricarboxylate transporter substrate binding protein n=1 Tax=Bordetella sp. BOR01 TaxID=2854779 RepID=UPI001C454004|nr:tripartite tricarboxylate transporter substrate binding protein [Bordetella sp. BOR01]MBV7483449.1 tripartite tricarboxylate transporter substrate binding protein [Bordetella sp. BOR01]